MNSRIQTPRGRRPAHSKIAARYYAAVIIFCSHLDVDVGLAKSFQYDEIHLLTYYSRKSILKLIGGGERYDEIDFHSSGQLAPFHIDKISTQSPTRTISYANINNRTPSKELWRRFRSLRGGAEDEISKGSVHKLGRNGLSEPTNNSTNESNDTLHATQNTSAGSALKSDSSGILRGEECEEISKRANQDNEGGIFRSFFSLFRSSVESEDITETPINTTHIAHKIPHGPDGRGGGGSLMAKPPPPAGDDFEVQAQEEEPAITTAVSNNATASETVNLVKSAQTDSRPVMKPSVRKEVSTAFVVPPSHKPLPSVDDKTGKDAKESKSSKGERILDETNVPATKSNSSNIQQNETGAIRAENDTSNNSTLLSKLNTSCFAEQPSDMTELRQRKDYTSSGYWIGIDLVASLGLSSLRDDLKISRALRPVRKAAAKATGLHGFFSGKDNGDHHMLSAENNAFGVGTSTVISIDEELGIHNANALEAEMLARRVVSRTTRRGRDNARARGNKNRPVRRWGFRRGQQQMNSNDIVSDYVVVSVLDSSPDALEYRRRKRVDEIDRLLLRGSERLLELQCERDDLLCAPNPLFNYTKKYHEETNHTFGDVRTTREFNFPSSDLVDEYIGELVSHGRLIRLNHTELWQSRSDDGMDDDENEIVGDDLLTPGADARRLYENLDQLEQGVNRNGNRNKSGGGSWLLRTGFGRNGGSLGEKLGETIEIGAYKGVCSAVMMVFARMLSGLHGVNLLSHSDIRTYIEQDPDLPPVDKRYGPLGRDNNYAQEAIKTAIQKGTKKKRKTSKHSSSQSSSSRRHGHELSDDAFIQRDAVVETLISHCQISAPLLKLFPLDWQRAIVGNIITLATAIISDFADGLQVQILGHALTISFKPITEADLIQHIGVGGFRQNHRRKRPDEFEAAVLLTAQDISESLSFLDGWLEWFERRVGGGVLRSQIGNLIARVVLTLVDEVLSGARLDLWSSQANGPRLYAALEYRTPSEAEEQSNE